MPDRPSAQDGVFWLTVSQLTSLIKGVIEEAVGQVWVQGELSGVKLHQPSGHLYFSLKDEQCLLRCVMFKRHVASLAMAPKDGEVVLVHGTVTVFERQGQYELIADDMVPVGARGLAALKLELLRAKLAAEGLFDPARKRPLPKFARVVGVVTSATGAALVDIVRVASRRWPLVRIVVSPALVQGEGAPQSVVQALQALVQWGKADVIIVGRGGGGPEDLSCFNDESVVRAIAACPVPVVSAVGHEVDVTLADLAADARASTPSAAAEMVVPDKREALNALAAWATRATRALVHVVSLQRERIRRLQSSWGMRAPKAIIQQRALRVDDLGVRLVGTTRALLALDRQRTEGIGERLRALDPKGILMRGYTMCLDHATRVLVASVRTAAESRVLDVVFHDGEATCQLM